MPLRSNRSLSRLCLLGVVIAALGLSACGRKGNLDLPPSASAVPGEPVAAATPGDSPAVPGGTVGVSRGGDAIAPVGPKKRIFLDSLLD